MLGWVWTFLGLVLRSSSTVMSTSMMVTMPLTFASSIVVDAATMPTRWRSIVEITPVSQVATSVCSLTDGTGVGREVTCTLISAALLVTVFGGLTMRRYRRGR